MSGGSYTDTCPVCGGSNMQCYSDRKPHDIASAVCLDCGFGYDTVDTQATLEEVNELRKEHALEPLEKLAEAGIV